jgi:hypothetical protein
MEMYVWNKFSRTRKSFLRRKLRLFACACCRRIEHLMKDPRSREAIRLGEQYADGLIGETAARAARSAARAAYNAANRAADEEYDRKPGIPSPFCWRKPYQALVAATDAAYAATQVFNIDGGTARAEMTNALEHERLARPRTPVTAQNARAAHKEADQAQAEMLRDLFGNPLRPLAVDPAWLRWNKGVVVKLARSIYDHQTLDQLPILADALEEAGCSDPVILSHCRGPGPHVRGCWVIDLLLGMR